MKFCVKCGTELKDGLKFCTSCGEPVDVAEILTHQTAETPVKPTQNQTATPKQENAFINETTETVSQIKGVIKNVNLKEEAERNKGFFTDMIRNPIDTIRAVAASDTNHLSIALAIIVVWSAASLIISLFSTFFVQQIGWTFGVGAVLQRLVSVATSTISPFFSVFVLSVAACALFKNKLGKFMPLVITITIANVPQAIGSVLRIIVSLIPRSSVVVGSINSLLYLLSIVLVYFGIKAFSGEEDESFFKKFVLIQCIYFASRIVLNAFGIWI